MCGHEWKVVRWRRMGIVQKLQIYFSSWGRVAGTNVVPEKPWHYMNVDWRCAICGDTHTTIHDSRIPLYGSRPGVLTWEELNAGWELEFGEKGCRS